MVQRPDGTRERISGCAPKHINTKVAAQQAMLENIERILHPERAPKQQEVMTFGEWFNGRFWREWVIGRMNTIRERLVIRNVDGTAKSDEQADVAIRRICRRAGLPVRYWHTLRHSFGTHAALFGVNSWRLQSWMGHKRIDETMLYVHVAEAHGREWPEVIREVALATLDPDARVPRGKNLAKNPSAEIETLRSA